MIMTDGLLHCYLQDVQLYGIDWDRPLPLEDEGTVEVPNCPCPITDIQLDELSNIVSPLSSSANYGIDLYQSVLQYVESR